MPINERVTWSAGRLPRAPHHREDVILLSALRDAPVRPIIVRPLARRGYSKEGLEVDAANLVPELTVSADGVFWHPLPTDANMQVSKHIFPLASAVERVQCQLAELARTGRVPTRTSR